MESGGERMLEAVLAPRLHCSSSATRIRATEHKGFKISALSGPKCVGGRGQTKSLFSFHLPNGAHIKPLNYQLLFVFSVQFRALHGTPSRAFSVDLYHSQITSLKVCLSWKVEKHPSPLSGDK